MEASAKSKCKQLVHIQYIQMLFMVYKDIFF